MAAALVSGLAACAETRLVKEGAGLEEVAADREACRREASLALRPPRPEPAPTFDASSSVAPMGSARDVNRVGDAQMADVMDRLGFDETTFENCLRARGFVAR